MEGASDSSGGGVLIVVLALYFIPLIVAMIRKVPNVGSVAVVNILLGWTLIGWVVALAMAVRSVPGEAEMAQMPQPVPTRRDTKPKAAAPTITLQGDQFLFGYTVDPPQYGIWDNQRPGPAVERFPYTEHGKSEGLARYQALEPSAEPFKPLPPSPD